MNLVLTCLLLRSLNCYANDSCDVQGDLLASKADCYLEGDASSCVALGGLESLHGLAGGVAGLGPMYASKLVNGLDSSQERLVNKLREKMPEMQKQVARMHLLEDIETLSRQQPKDTDGAASRERVAGAHKIAERLMLENGDADFAVMYKRAYGNLTKLRGQVEQAYFEAGKSAFAWDLTFQSTLKNYEAELQELASTLVPPEGQNKVGTKTYEEYLDRKQALIEKYSQKSFKFAVYTKLFPNNGVPKFWKWDPKGNFGDGDYVPAPEKLSQTIEQQAANVKTPKWRRGSTSSGLALGLLGVGAGIGAESRGQMDIQLCKKELGLSPEEVDFLTNKRMLGMGRAKVYSDGDCHAFVISNASRFMVEARAQFKPLPKGLCDMITAQNKRLDDLIGPGQDDPRSCNLSPKGKNFEVTADKKFIYKDGDQTYQASYDQDLNFPALSSLQIFEADGKTLDRLKTQAFQERYKILHPPNIGGARPDLVDIGFQSQKYQSLFPKGLISSAVKARVISGTNAGTCGVSWKNSETAEKVRGRR